MDFWNLFENPTFMFVFHEIVCILGALYYLPHIFTRFREKKEGKKHTETSGTWSRRPDQYKEVQSATAGCCGFTLSSGQGDLAG